MDYSPLLKPGFYDLPLDRTSYKRLLEDMQSQLIEAKQEELVAVG